MLPPDLTPATDSVGNTEWEERYRTHETPWDKNAPHPELVAYLAKEPISGRVLVPGCGMGHDCRALAAAGAVVTGIDIAPSAVKAAKAFPAVGELNYELADLFALPPTFQGAFDWAWEHTCFCAIPRKLRPAYVEAIYSALKPGGLFLAIFYLDPGQARPEDGPPFESSLSELNGLFLPRFEIIREWSPTQTYKGREGGEWVRLMRKVG